MQLYRDQLTKHIRAGQEILQFYFTEPARMGFRGPDGVPWPGWGSVARMGFRGPDGVPWP